jgi:hypothetical protein
MLLLTLFDWKNSILFFMEHTKTGQICSKDKIRLAVSSALQQLTNISAI